MPETEISNAHPLRQFRFLGQVRFTLLLLLGGALIFAIGTVVESRGGREEAWALIYGTFWFDLVLALIVLNLIGAVVIRLPIQRHQWSFVLTHLGIVLLLTGAWISRTFGYEGRLFVTEGETERTLVMEGTEVVARWADRTEEARFSFPLSGRIPSHVMARASERLPELRVVEHVADGVAHATLEAGEDADPPATAVLVTGPRTRAGSWLIAGDHDLGSRELGPLTVALVRGSPDAYEAPATDEALFITFDGTPTPTRLPLPGSVGVDVDCGNGVTARVTRLLRRARVVDGELVDVAGGPANPAVEVELRSGEDAETHLVFAEFPDHTTLQERRGDRPLAERLGLHAHAQGEPERIVIGAMADGRLLLAVPGATAAREIAVGKPEIVGDTGLVLKIDRFLPQARRKWSVEASAEGQETGRPFLKISAGREGDTRAEWFGLGSSQTWSLGDRELLLSYGRQTRSLPFTVHLHEFEIETHPGSSKPAEYSSRVTVRDDESETESDHVVSMNRPLDVAGFRVFQSSYQLGRSGGPDTTILSVARDPGVPLVYLSFVLTCIGIAWYVKRKAPVGEAAQGEQPQGGLVIEAPTTQKQDSALEAGATGPSVSSAILLLLAGLIAWSPGTAAAETLAEAGTMPVEETRGWAIVADGRVKPLETFAKETALRVTGRERYGGFDSLEILWGYVLAPADARTRPFVRVDSLDLKAALALDPGAKRFSLEELLDNAEFRRLVDSGLQVLRRDGEPDRLMNDALEVHSTLVHLDGLMRGEGLALVPVVGPDGGWANLAQLDRAEDPRLRAAAQGFRDLAKAYRAQDAAAFGEAARGLTLSLREIAPEDYPAASALERELFHEDLNAFGKAWKLYLLGFFVLLFVARPERRWGHALAMVLLGSGFLLHLAGIGLRWAIAGRAPVSNMYESLVFMGAGAIALGLIPELFLRKRYLGLTAGMIGFLTLAFAENLPIDATISPLVPVLANTYWLSVHVMTIMLSYSAFALAMALAHVAIALQLFKPAHDEGRRTVTSLIDKMLQVGLLFLAAGIACGAVWANESWGRYWGWDPKETWSLITFFVYLAVVHARFAGWLKDFGLAASTIVAFMSVVMTYYGVNFVLAAGMHSYGFAEGGRPQAATYVIVEFALLVGAWVLYRRRTAAVPDA